jgi:hypothetical protein
MDPLVYSPSNEDDKVSARITAAGASTRLVPESKSKPARLTKRKGQLRHCSTPNNMNEANTDSVIDGASK